MGRTAHRWPVPAGAAFPALLLGDLLVDAAFLKGIEVWPGEETFKYPPFSPSEGELWTTSGGHSATFESGVWVANIPPAGAQTANMCVLTGNCQLWVGSDGNVVDI